MSKAKKVDWSGHFTKLDAIFGGKPAPGKPGSASSSMVGDDSFVSVPVDVSQPM